MSTIERWWLVDTGASHSISPYPSDLSNAKSCNEAFDVVGNKVSYAKHTGCFALLFPTRATAEHRSSSQSKASYKALLLLDAYCIPGNQENIVAYAQLRKVGLDLDLPNQRIFSYADPSIHAPIIMRGGRPFVQLQVTTDRTVQRVAFSSTPPSSIKGSTLETLRQAYGTFDIEHLPGDFSPTFLTETSLADTWDSKKVLLVPPPEDKQVIYDTIVLAIKEFDRVQPPKTCVTLLVPHDVRSRYNPLLSRFQKMASYPAGTCLFDNGLHLSKPFNLYYKDAHTQCGLTPAMLMHARLGHPSAEVLKRVLSDWDTHSSGPAPSGGLTNHMDLDLEDCVVCAVAAGRRPKHVGRVQPMHTAPSAPFQCISTDIHGPLVESKDGSKYCILFMCQLTRWLKPYYLRSKSQAGTALEHFVLWISRREWSLTDAPPAWTKLEDSWSDPVIKHIAVIKSDNALEFVALHSVFAVKCRQLGIRQIRAAEYAHEQMGDVEIKWSNIQSKSRKLLMNAQQDSTLWPLSFDHSVYLLNRLPQRHLKWKSAYEALFKVKPDLSQLITFGSPCSLFIGDIGKLPKTAPRSRTNLIYIGHDDNSRAAKFLSTADYKTVWRGGMYKSHEISGMPRLRDMHNKWEITRFAPIKSDFEACLDGALVNSLDTLGAIVGHKAYRTVDTPSHIRVSAIVKVRPQDAGQNTESVWISVSDFITHEGSSTTERRVACLMFYITSWQRDTPLNPYYPLFSSCKARLDTESTAWETGAVLSFTYDPPWVDTEHHTSSFEVLILDPAKVLDNLESNHIRMNDEHNPGTETEYWEGRKSNLTASACKTRLDGVTEPETLRDVLIAPDFGQWLQSIIDEIENLRKMETFDLTIKCPRGTQPIEVTLKFKVKYNADGSLNKRKSRLVARGFNQVYLENYSETFAPASQLDSLRLLVSFAAQNGLTISSLDVTGAFLHATLKEDIWIRFGHDLPIPELRGTTAKLNKSLYGLKQAGHDWWKLLRGFLVNTLALDLKANSKDPCLYHIISGKLTVLILVHVDDCIIAYNDDNFIDALTKALSKEYEFTFDKSPDQVLGIKVEHLPNFQYALSQTRLIDQTTETFGLRDAHPKPIPLDPGTKLTPEVTCSTTLPFLSLLGVLMWIMRCTRPDIATAISIIASFSHCFGESHFTALLCVVRFLKGTREDRLMYVRTDTIPSGLTRLNLYTDSDYAVCKITRRSRTGWLLKMGSNVIAYGSTRQSLVTLSTTEAELVAMCEGVRNLVGVIAILQEFCPAELPVTTHVDNQGAIAVGSDQVHNSRSKHIDVRFFFTRELCDDGVIDIIYINTTENPSDIFTKLLPRPAFTKGRHGLTLTPK